MLGFAEHDREHQASVRSFQTNDRLCENMHRCGQCRHGDKCYFAHSQEESDNFKLWKRSQQPKSCSHSTQPLDQHFRTRTRQAWLKGMCRFGATCTFAHGEGALRPMRGAPPTHSATPVPPPTLASTRLEGSCSGEAPHADLPPCTTDGGDLEEVTKGKYKSQLCLFFMNQARCRNGAGCTFAHGHDDLVRPARGALLLSRPPTAGAFCQDREAGRQRPIAEAMQASVRGSGRDALGRQCLQSEASTLEGSAAGTAHLVPMPVHLSYAPPQRPSASIFGRAPQFNLLAYEQQQQQQQHALPSPCRQQGSPRSPTAAHSGHSMGHTSQQRPASPGDLLGADFPPLGSNSAARPASHPVSCSLASSCDPGSATDAASKAASSRCSSEGGGEGTPPCLPQAQAGQGPSTPTVASVLLPACPSLTPSSGSRSSCEEMHGAATKPCSPCTASSSPAHRQPAPDGASPAKAPLPRSASAGAQLECYPGSDAAASWQLPPLATISTARSADLSAEPGSEAQADKQASGCPSPPAVSFLAPSSPRVQSPVQVFFRDASSTGASSSGGSLQLHSREGSTCDADLAPPPLEAPAPPLPPQSSRRATVGHGGRPLSPAPLPGPSTTNPLRPVATAFVNSEQHPGQAAGGGKGVPAGGAMLPCCAPDLSMGSRGSVPAHPAGSRTGAGPCPAIPSVNCIHSLCCPLTQALFNDPVVAADGFTYEKAAIHDWLYRQGNDLSPVTGQPLPHKVLVQNMSMRGAVAEVAHVLSGLRSWAEGGEAHHVHCPPPLPPPRPTRA